MLEEEIATKSCAMDEYLQHTATNDTEKVAHDLIEQRKECSDLKTKLRSYNHYVRHLRERNTAIMNSIMDDMDKRCRGPQESVDDGFADISDESGTPAASKCSTCNNSREGSQNTSRTASRRVSLKDSDVQTDIELAMDVEPQEGQLQMEDLRQSACAVNYAPDNKMDNRQDFLNEIKQLKTQVQDQTNIIHSKLEKEHSLEVCLRCINYIVCCKLYIIIKFTSNTTMIKKRNANYSITF